MLLSNTNVLPIRITTHQETKKGTTAMTRLKDEAVAIVPSMDKPKVCQ